MKPTKPRSTNASIPAAIATKKKIDNVNTEFIRYINEREEKRGNYGYTPNVNQKDEEEEE